MPQILEKPPNWTEEKDLHPPWDSNCFSLKIPLNAISALALAPLMRSVYLGVYSIHQQALCWLKAGVGGGAKFTLPQFKFKLPQATSD